MCSWSITAVKNGQEQDTINQVCLAYQLSEGLMLHMDHAECECNDECA